MDGPSVNWDVLEMLEDQRAEKDLSKTLNIWSCSQHIVHGALKMVQQSQSGVLITF